MQASHLKDTICAIATAPGGALGIIRISGTEALAKADKVFVPKDTNRSPLADRRPATVAYGQAVASGGEVIDEVVATVWHAPHSYTGEDTVELTCHGSPYVMRRLIEALTAADCRPAAPGEYTQRAYLNGKMDLSQAEAVADLIAAKSRRAHHVALCQMRGSMTSSIAVLRDRLLRLTALAELELDFSDHEELEFAPRSELLSLAREAQEEIKRLAGTFVVGNAIRNGVAVAIVGQTNVGKSTLLNALAGDEVAIVSDIHGTTRDAIEDTICIGGMEFRLVDTAGIRSTDDEVERLGIGRTFDRISRADIVVWVVDATQANAQIEEMGGEMARRCQGKPLIVALNKIDLAPAAATMSALPPQSRLISISAKAGIGLDRLRQAMVEATGADSISPEEAIVTSARHHAALSKALDAITRTIEGLQSSLPTDLVCQDLREAIAHLAEITGDAITPESVLQTIFSEFCVGK